MGYKNILIPLDGLELAEKVLPHVPIIAAPGANIHILSILTVDSGIMAAIAMSGGLVNGDILPNQYDPALINERRNYLSRITEPLQKLGYSVTLEVEPGDVVDSIIEAAHEGCDAILMATHGRTGLSKALLGSVAQSVVVRSPCPVVLISPAAIASS